MPSTITIDLTDPRSLEYGLAQISKAVVKLATTKVTKPKGVSASFEEKSQRALAQREERVFKAKA